MLFKLPNNNLISTELILLTPAVFQNLTVVKYCKYNAYHRYHEETLEIWLKVTGHPFYIPA